MARHEGFDRKYGDPQVFYAHHYERVLRSGAVGKAQDRTHRALEKHSPPGSHFSRVLEVGAGSGEHFPFVRHSFDEYIETDLRPRSVEVSDEPRRKFEVADAQKLPFESESFDRLVATCLLLHLPDPEQALSEWRRVLRPGGQASLLVPCDPGLLVRTLRAALTAPAVRRSGFEGYQLFNARDHRNHVGSIDQMVRWVFRTDDLHVSRYPLGLPSWNLNAFFVYTATLGRP